MRIVMMAVEFGGADEDFKDYVESLATANDPHLVGDVICLDRHYSDAQENEASAAWNVADGLVKHFAEMNDREMLG